MIKECQICGNFLKEIEKNTIKEKIDFKHSRNNSFCEKCNEIIKKYDLIEQNIKLNIDTYKGIISLNVKKKNGKFLISLHNKEYKYPLFAKETNNQVKATVNFYNYEKMLEKNEFKIIRNIESIDDKYRRIYSRVKFGILFNY